MKILFVFLVFLSACTVQMNPDNTSATMIRNHEMMLQAITEYVSNLQEKGILPKPEVKNDSETKK